MQVKPVSYILVFFFLLGLTSCSKKETVISQHFLLSEGWKIQQSGKINQNGQHISSLNAQTGDWVDADVPCTVMGALTKAGLYPDITVGTNMQSVDKAPFDSSWWFRKEFQLPELKKNEYAMLNFDGLGYYANVWLNGELVASRDQVYGPFRQFSFDITKLSKKINVLAVEVFKAQPGDPNIGFVDWNPRPLDENMGIFREVHVSVTGSVGMTNTRVTSKVNTESLKEAWLTIETELVNHSDTIVSGKLDGIIENISFSVPVSLKPGEKKLVKIKPEEMPALHIYNPRIWWCNTLGNPELYQLNLKFNTDDLVSDQKTITFGIREIKDYFTELGFRGFILNGRKVLIKSAGWTDDIFLRDTPESNETQVQYAKDMNLNSIRFENIWGTSQNVYDMCDKYGLMALVGWSCQWEWEAYLGKPCDEFGGIQTVKEMDLIAESFEDQVLWLRNHPSIIAWFVGSDMIPRPSLERKYLKILERIDDRPYIAAAGKIESNISGNTGMKMYGPYEYVGPNYWHEDRRYGGAYGFNTETGIGAQLPVYESIEKMIPKDKLWPIGVEWSYHCTASSSAMNSLSVLTEAMNQKYGEAKDLQDFLMKADVMNYEGTKAMFEAFRSNLPKTTGIVQWMLNSAWPSFYWQLYDHYMIPTSAYYGVKKANLPQQLIYDYYKNSVYIVNETLDRSIDRIAIIRLYSMDSKLLLQKEMNVTVESNSSFRIGELDTLRENSFLSLELLRKDSSSIASNFYWLSPVQDEYDWEKTNWIHTPMQKYADQKPLETLPQSELQAKTSIKNTGDYSELNLNLKNSNERISFFIRAVIKNKNGEIIFPVFWSDNYFSLLPGEERTFTCSFKKPAQTDGALKLYLSGWNIQEQQIDL